MTEEEKRDKYNALCELWKLYLRSPEPVGNDYWTRIMSETDMITKKYAKTDANIFVGYLGKAFVDIRENESVVEKSTKRT